MIPENETSCFDTFADCLSTTVIAKLAPDTGKKRKVKGRRNEIKPTAAVAQPNSDELGDAGELSEFVQVRRCVRFCLMTANISLE